VAGLLIALVVRARIRALVIRACTNPNREVRPNTGAAKELERWGREVRQDEKIKDIGGGTPEQQGNLMLQQ